MAMPVSGVAADTAHVPAGRALGRIGRAIRSNRKATVGGVLLLGESLTSRLGVSAAAVLGGIALAISARR